LARCTRQIRSTSAAQSDLIGAPEPMSIEAVLAAQNGGSVSALPELGRLSVTLKIEVALGPRPDRVQCGQPVGRQATRTMACYITSELASCIRLMSANGAGSCVAA